MAGPGPARHPRRRGGGAAGRRSCSRAWSARCCRRTAIDEQDLGARNQGPSWAHPFGTAALGEDMLTRVLVAGRVSLLIGLATAVVATVAGAGLGLSAGGRGGWLDSALVPADRPGPDRARLRDPDRAQHQLRERRSGRDHPDPRAAVVAAPLPAHPRLGAAHSRAAVRPGRPRRRGGVVAHRADATCCPRPPPRSPSFAALAVGVAILTESALSFLSLGTRPRRPAVVGHPDDRRPGHHRGPPLAHPLPRADGAR